MSYVDKVKLKEEVSRTKAKTAEELLGNQTAGAAATTLTNISATTSTDSFLRLKPASSPALPTHDPNTVGYFSIWRAFHTNLSPSELPTRVVELLIYEKYSVSHLKGTLSRLVNFPTYSTIPTESAIREVRVR